MADAGPANTPLIGIQAPLGFDRRRQPATDSIVTQFATPARYVVMFGASHAPQPSVPPVEFARQEEGMPSRRSHMMGEATASRRAPLEIGDRPRRRNQWPPLPAS